MSFVKKGVQTFVTWKIIWEMTATRIPSKRHHLLQAPSIALHRTLSSERIFFISLPSFSSSVLSNTNPGTTYVWHLPLRAPISEQLFCFVPSHRFRSVIRRLDRSGRLIYPSWFRKASLSELDNEVYDIRFEKLTVDDPIICLSLGMRMQMDLCKHSYWSETASDTGIDSSPTTWWFDEWTMSGMQRQRSSLCPFSQDVDDESSQTD